MLKVPNTELLIKDQRACPRCWRCVTLCCIMNNWSKAMYFTGVESGVCGFYTTLHAEYYYSCLRCQRLLYSVYSGLLPCQEGRLFIWAFCLGGLVVHHQSVQGGSFVNFLGLVNYKGDCSQSPILKTNWVFSNLVILTYLQESCILHTLKKLPA